MNRSFSLRFFFFLFLLSTISLIQPCADPSERDVLTAMRKAAYFMANEVSNRGGYVSHVSSDLTEQWGEETARPTQIWVQGGTPDMGMFFLDAYEATKDEQYLRYAERAANALIYGPLS